MLASLRRVVRAILMSAVVLPLCASASQIVNGDFETGNLGGWNMFLYGAALPSAASPWTPIQGNFSALILALSSQDPKYDPCAPDNWTRFCSEPLPRYTGDGTTLTYPYFSLYGQPGGGVPPGFPDALPYFPLTREGGVIGQDITVQAGDSLTWDWKCVGECYDYDDGWFYARSATGLASMRKDTGTLESASFTFPSGGTWSVYFGVGQYPEGWYWSGVLLDNVVLHETPEPGALALLGLSLAGLAFTRRRKQHSLVKSARAA